MGDSIISGMVTVATAVVGIAILAVLVSKNANTANVISSAGGAFTKSIAAAVSPIVGGSGFNGFAGGGVGENNYY